MKKTKTQNQLPFEINLILELFKLERLHPNIISIGPEVFVKASPIERISNGMIDRISDFTNYRNLIFEIENGQIKISKP